MKSDQPQPDKRNLQTVYGLIFKSGRAVQLVNLITLYRIVTAPLLLVLAWTGQMHLFKWLLLASFSTDAVDGFLARKYKATSILGARLDSLGDDLTILVSIIALALTRSDFLWEERATVIGLILLFFVQLFYSLLRYGKISSFHTRLAKLAALMQGIFFLSTFFFQNIIYPFFYIASVITCLELVEEIVIVYYLPEWKNDVKGLFWIFREKLKAKKEKMAARLKQGLPGRIESQKGL